MKTIGKIVSLGLLERKDEQKGWICLLEERGAKLWKDTDYKQERKIK